ncbi:MAG: MBL fold metallo-hydrolase, partial [Bacteroidota bacterium]
MELKFCGAAQQVTGSAHLITLDDGYTILLDCGLYQGRSKDMADFNSNWYFDPKQIDCLILSHAHIDHSGRVPKLVRDGFRGDIICTHATRSLCAIMLLDSAKIQERDAAYYNKRLARKKRKSKGKKPRSPLYTSEDIGPTMGQFVGIGYNRWHPVSDKVELLFRDAGHILGSANVTLKIKENGRTVRLGFTGDIGRPNRPILRDPQPMPAVDYLISESTYGDKDHDTAPAEIERFLRIITQTCLEKKGKLIIPAFSVGRTQEIVYMLDQLETAGRLPQIPVYVDSPLAVNATQVFGSHPECFDNNLNEYLLIDD